LGPFSLLESCWFTLRTCGARPISPLRRKTDAATNEGSIGNTIDDCQAEYVLVPDAMANLSPVPDGLSDEQVLMRPDIMSTGFAGAESGTIHTGDAVAIFAQGPIGLRATVDARLMGASKIIVVETVPSATAAMEG
jgi:threonine dehydrogenase-like Zn-dependent dehydrogenase